MPAFLSSSVPLDVSEGINWGSEWQWGYYKHPPLSSWILYSFYQLFGHVGPYLLSQLYILLTLILIYQLGKKIWSTTVALIGSLLTLAVIYYSYPSLEFNHNVAQFPIWAGLYLAFHQSLTQNRFRDWVLLGILGGLGMLTKYTVIFLLIPMAVYLILPKQWSLLKQPKPWIAAFVMLAIFAPHLYWLTTHDWLPLSYASGRSQEAAAGAYKIQRHFGWIAFITAQFVAHIPLLVMLAFNRKHLTSVHSYKNHLPNGASLLWYMWLSPIVVLITLNLVFGIGLRDMWGMPMWALSGMLAASLIASTTHLLTITKLRKALIIWLSLVTVLMVVYVGLGDKIRHKPSRMQWPEQALSTQAQDTWQTVSSCNLDSVSGDRWLGSLVAMNSGFPSQMISGPANLSPWMSIERLQENGTLVMWQEGTEDIVLPLLDDVSVITATELTSNHTNVNALVKKQGQWQIEWRDDKIEQPLLINWIAYVPSHCFHQPK
ncbi:glycosyltransferase family 39 protein [Psychrobacter piscatorii]|uniref:glycosyltransferase family 39 protein n=1 Tax=Psychrobacter piscatorii TaxID=554343 RepID=UPI00191AFB18|nr:glycosyltransferase family 39 protein [Psychrobacter piscatorii]